MMHPAGILLRYASSFPFGLEVFPEEADVYDSSSWQTSYGDFFYHFMRKLGAPVGSTGKWGKINASLQFWVSAGDISKITLPYE